MKKITACSLFFLITSVSFNAIALDETVKADSLNGRWHGQDQNGRPCWIEINHAQYELDYNWISPNSIDWTWVGDDYFHLCTPYKGTMHVTAFFDGSLIDRRMDENLETPVSSDAFSDQHGYSMNEFQYNNDKYSIDVKLHFNGPTGVDFDREGISNNFPAIADHMKVWLFSLNGSTLFGASRECTGYSIGGALEKEELQ